MPILASILYPYDWVFKRLGFFFLLLDYELLKGETMSYTFFFSFSSMVPGIPYVWDVRIQFNKQVIKQLPFTEQHMLGTMYELSQM